MGRGLCLCGEGGERIEGMGSCPLGKEEEPV